MKDFQENLARRHRYRKLKVDESKEVRMKYLNELPKGLNINGDKQAIYSLNGSIIANEYNRIVIGDYGAFIEFDASPITETFPVKEGETYRQNVSYSCKYYYLTPPNDTSCKIYYQTKSVDYADYIPGKFYVSVYDVKLKDYEN